MPNRLNILQDSEEFKSEIEILSYIKTNDIKYIYIFNDQFLIDYILSIKKYYPYMLIEHFSYTCNKEIIFYLNYVDKHYVNNLEIYNFYNDRDVQYQKKPPLSYINLITFGTFDLFHIGHQNIFDKCAKYSDNIIVGLSTDEFTYTKKNIYPTDNFKKREDNILNCKNVTKVFAEESMEKKNIYIKEYNSNILIMGDDWKDQFDWVDCSVIYFERTPNISSTLLRKIDQQYNFSISS